MIKVEKLSFGYPEEAQNALQDISFQVPEGSFVVLCGQSGSGKSTLLRHLKKEQIPAGKKTGSVRIAGESIVHMSDRNSCQWIGYVGQWVEEQIVTDQVWHELAFGLENLGIDREEMQIRVAEMAEYFGISNWFDKKIDRLSGGQKQILNLAAITVMQPKILLLDEPTAQLDPIGAERFLQTVKKLNEDFGITVILSEQRLEQALPLADQVLILHKGRLLGQVSPQKLPTFLIEKEKEYGREFPISAGMPIGIRLVKKALELDTDYSLPSAKLSSILAPLTIKDGKEWLSNWCQTFCQHSFPKIKNILQENHMKAEKKNKSFALVAKEISFGYQRHDTLLKDLWVSIPKGCIYGILGGNGAGKSTLLKLFSGIYKPQHGKIRSNGTCVYLPQNPKLMFTELTVEEELMEVFLYNRKKQGNSIFHQTSCQNKDNHQLPEQLSQVKKILKILHLEEQSQSNPMDLSGGQAQKLAFGKLLLMEADLICLDEPTKGLDALGKKELAKLLQACQEIGKTIIIVSHDISFCANYTQYCSLLFQGRFVATAKTKDFFKENRFYTTQTRKLASLSFPDCLTDEDLLKEMEERMRQEKKIL